jgi:hypothetical protein
MLSDTFKKCLSITGSFEGASWGGSNGNFDGAGCSAFILQWNFLSALKDVIYDMYNADIVKFKALVGDKTQDIINMCMSPGRDGIQSFITEITTGGVFNTNGNPRFFTGGKSLKPEWVAVFKAIGNEFITVQMQHAQSYFDAAVSECKTFNLNTERSVAFMFDFCVQRGKGNLSTEQQQFLVISKDPSYIEDDDTWLKHILEVDLQQMANSPWKLDSYSRRACILNDGGIVHGKNYDLGKEFGLTDDKVL